MNQLTKFLVDGILNEGNGKVIAAYGGGFKPPTEGHLEVVKNALKQNPDIDEFIIYVGGGERDGITQAEAILIWEIYQTYLPMKVKIEPSKAPIGDVVRLGKNNPQDTVYFVIGGREGREDDMKDIESRTKGIEDKYPNMKIKIITTPDTGMSGTNARQAAKVSPEEFYKYLPSELKDEEKEEVYNIVKPMVKESLNENASYSSDIDYKAHIKELTKYMIKDGWNILPLPKVVFKHGDSENARDFFGKTAYYDPNTQTIVLYTEGRHPKDIVRSFSHEMVHHEQNLEGRLGNIQTTNTQEDDRLNDIEKEANLNGTMTFRNWTDSLNESLYLDIPKFNQPKTFQQHLIESINEISLSKDNAVEINGDLTGGNFTVGDITYEYSIKNIPNPYKDLGLFYNIQFTPTGEVISTPQMGKENYIKILSTMYKIIVDFVEKKKPEYIGIASLDNNGKNYHKVYANLTDNKFNSIPGYFRKDVSLPFDTPQGKGRFIVLKKKDNLDESNKPYKHKYGFDDKLGKDPFGLNAYARELAQGLEEAIINEGRYDTISNKISSIVFKEFKDIHDRGDKEGEFEFRVDHPDDEHDIPSKDFYFDLLGKVVITDDEYMVDGGANAGFDKDGNEITPLISVKFKIPKNPDWQRVSFDIKDVIRHELEHLTQDGDNVKPGKQMDDDQMIRDLIDLDLLPKADYFRLPKEIDSMLQGLYFKAKKSRKPYIDVINDYLDTQPINDKERENILKIWRSRAKALSLPLFEELEEMEYEIYSDMDGVITDFDAQFMKASGGIRPSEYERNMGKDKFWEFIDGKGVGFWAGMPWMPDGKQYWDYIKEYNPILLSSPSRSNTSRLGKRLWVRNNLPGTKLILAQAKHKQNYARENRILIDDRPSNIEEWKSQGGIGILHISAASTIKQLKELGL